MTSRGSGGRGEEGGRGGAGGRGTPGRGRQAGRQPSPGGSFAYGTPPPPPPGGRGGRGGFVPARGISPGRGRGGRGSGSSFPGRAGVGYSSPQYSGGRGRGASPFQPGRGAAGGRGSPGASGGSPGGYALAHGGVGGGKLFGRGAEAVAWDRDKERGLLKVGPPAGQRFSAAWLRGLSSFVAWQQQQQQQQQQHGQQQQQRPGRQPVTAERLQGLPAGRPPVTVERLPSGDDSEGAEEVCSSGSPAGEQAGEAVAAEEPCVPAAGAAVEAASPSQGSHSCGSCSADEAGEADAESEDRGRSGASTPSTSGSDLGWASALAAASAANSSDGQASPGIDSTPRAAAGGDGSPGDEGCRAWWPASPVALATAEPVVVTQQPAAPQRLPGGAKVQLSLRLERMALTDREAAMAADFCEEHAASVAIKQLWLFDNRLGDEGAAAVARILRAHPAMLEVHLSHNMLTCKGAAALLEALPVPGDALPGGTPGAAAEPGQAAAGEQEAAAAAAQPASLAAPPPAKPVWLRLEWNRISLTGLMEALEEQHSRRGLLVDLPSAIRADAAPSLPNLPPYLAAAAAAAPAAPTAVPASRGARNALQFMIERCHARLPWVSCQYQLPSEAAVLSAARRSWRANGAAAQEAAPAAGAGESAAGGGAATAGAAGGAEGEAAAAAGAGPLLLFPDTSALLPMLGAGERVSLPTWLTLDLLAQLAQQGRFGRALPPREQVFLVVTDSVLKQLDGLKNDPAARPAVRRFLGQGLDACGPAGADFLTVLGAHEGEGLLVEHDAAVAGSRSADVSTKGQRADQRIVEVGLFFQQEVLREAAAPDTSSTGSGGGGSASPGGSPLTAASFPVLLLSGDNAQVQTARSHGLPAARMADLAAAQRQLEAALAEGQPLAASLLRSCLGPAAVTGLGAVAARSLQAEFDDAVAALHMATEALTAVAAAAASEGPAEEALVAVRRALGGGGGLLPALQGRLAELQGRVATHQDPSRLLRWASSGRSSLSERSERGAGAGAAPSGATS